MINTAIQKHQHQFVYLTVNEEDIQEPEVEFEEELVSPDFLMKIIQELPERYRLVFNLYSMDGFSHKEISKMLKISEGTSKSNLARARLKLKERIESCQQPKTVKGL